MTKLAPVDRERRRAEVSRLLERIRVGYGITQEQCARSVGAPRYRVQSWEDPEQARHIGLADAMGLPIAMQRELVAAWAHELNCIVADKPAAAPTVRDDLEHFNAVTRGTTEAAAQMAEHIASGALAAGDVEALRRALREAAEAIASADARAACAGADRDRLRAVT